MQIQQGGNEDNEGLLVWAEQNLGFLRYLLFRIFA